MLTPSLSKKSKNYGMLIIEKVTSIYNGDTFRANIAGLHSLIGERIDIRVAGVDTPEMRSKRKQEKDLARQANHS